MNKGRALDRQGKSIIHLEIGEPDFDTPANVIEAPYSVDRVLRSRNEEHSVSE